jgi:hypothetical protein
MPKKPEKKSPKHSKDERLVIDMDPEEAVKQLLRAGRTAIPPKDEETPDFTR